MENKEFILTQEGYDNIEKELEYLKTEKRTEIAERIKVALGFGDLSENSEYDEAKNAQAQNEIKIADLENKLRYAKIINEDEIDTNTVQVGNTVKVHDMDFDEDVCSSKRTLCTILKTKKNALKFMSVFYITGYFSIIILSVKTQNYWYLLSLLTLPLVVELFELLKLYNEDKTILPYAQPWHYPLENWEQVKQTSNASFFLRFMFARNISTWFMLSICFALMIS